jgi:phosphotransferase system HPr-like phosphotransfer protein
MREMRIELDTIDKVKKFVGIISAFDGDFDILAGRYIIDAKSILGIFSVDLSKPLTLRIEHEENWESVREVLQEFVY